MFRQRQNIDGVDLYEPEAAQGVLLATWSRWSRRRLGRLWTVLLPFAVINAIGEMGPTERAPRRRLFFRCAVVLWSCTATVVGAVWAVVIVERIARPLGADARWFVAGVLVAVALVALLALRRSSWSGRLILGGHLVLFVAVLVVALGWQPAGRAIHGWCFLPQDGETIDLPASMILLSTAVALLCAVAASAAVRTRNPESQRGGLVALAIAGSSALLHSLGSLVGLGASWLAAYINNVSGRRRESGDDTALLILNYSGDGRSSGRAVVDRLPLYGVAGGVIVVVAFCVVLAVSKARSASTDGDRVGLAQFAVRRAHRILPTIIPLAMLGAALVVVAVPPNDSLLRDGIGSTITNIVLHALAAVAVFIVVWPHGLRHVGVTLETMQDVLGFWPARSHPFCPASYRPDTVRGLQEMVSSAVDPTMLIGHSQGSVLAAWAARTDARSWAHVHLVTCGSPISSLYMRSFPSAFPSNFPADVGVKVADWVNLWRPGDPIGTEIPLDASDSGHHPLNRRLASDLREFSGHSNYWSDPDAGLSNPTAGAAAPLDRRSRGVPSGS